MGLDLVNSTSASNSVFRVVCGEMVLTDKQNLHSEAVFGLVRSGNLEINIDDRTVSLGENDVYFISPNRKYHFTAFNDAAVDVISLNFSNASAVSQDYIPQSIIRALVNGNCSSFLQVYSKMYGLFYELFSNKYVKILDVEMRSKKYRALLRVTHYIDEHYSEGVSLEEVAEATGISRYYVSHLFKELMDNTFVGYVNELRLNHAAMLLVTTDSPIIEIASKSGFNNLSNFNRAFKMYFGKTPSSYRKG